MPHYFVVVIYTVTFFNALGYQQGSATEVTNTDQIRLINDGPVWNAPEPEIVITTRKPTTNAEHRSLDPNYKKNKFRTKNEDIEIYPPSQEGSKELHQFLKTYAEKFKRKNPTTTEEPEMDSVERFRKVELITKTPDDSSNRLANLLLGTNYQQNGEEKPKRLNINKHKPNHQQHKPGDEKKGWVSLEIMPWSMSKVAKWHSSAVKPISENRPRPDYHVSTVPAWNYPIPKPVVTYNQNPPNYNKKPFNYNSDSYMRPFDATPMSSGENVYVQQEYTDETLRPWNKHSQFSYAQYDTNNSDEEDEELGNAYSSIITDGLPANFPSSQPGYNRRKGFPEDSEHPINHPFNSDGDWVLLTTTKGYKGSSGKKRSLDIDSIPEQDVESIKSHKSVRLTVLPPLTGSKVNMTTSHGGLLQVESTFETVDEAQRMAAKKDNMKKAALKTKHLKRPAKQINTTTTVAPTTTTSSKFKFPVPSSVLAAVGAGMIPATMAMLVPMAMGRRRKREVFHQITQPETLRFALPIQLRHQF